MARGLFKVYPTEFRPDGVSSSDISTRMLNLAGGGRRVEG